MTPLDENELFEWGATAWRMDIATYRVIRPIVDRIRWHRPADMPKDFSGHIHSEPVGTIEDEDRRVLMHAFAEMLNDPSLVPGVSQMGTLHPGDLEIQNGAYDPGWHHDGLAGKRKGHSGDFFVIAYFGESLWQDAWGGQFEYAKRTLCNGWSCGEFEPTKPIRRIAPQERTVMLGWNQNPRLIHRAVPLNENRNRMTLIASLHLKRR